MSAFSDKNECWVLEPREIADLKEIFDEACQRSMTTSDTEAAQTLAKRLIAATRSGVKDREMLLRLSTNA
jgi:hypothetical protein